MITLKSLLVFNFALCCRLCIKWDLCYCMELLGNYETMCFVMRK